MNTNLHPNVARALKELEESRAAILNANADSLRVSDILTRHPRVAADSGMVQQSGCIAYYLTPETMGDLAALIKELREAFTGKRYNVEQKPDEDSILYWIGPTFFRALLKQKCTFKKVGVETVERPVYELVCK